MLSVIAKVAEMGYAGVEFAGFHGHSPSSLRQALDESGIKCPSTHTPLDAFSEANFSATVDAHLALGATYAIIPWIPEAMRNSPEACADTASKMTELSGRLAEHGLRTGFHAHEGDMRPLADGSTAWNLLAKGTPESFVMQYDTANGMEGGADPVQPILDLPGRSALVHLKEFKRGGHAIIGEGEVPWPRVFDACETVGRTEWYVVEHENDPRMTSMEAVELCFQALQRMGKA